MLVVQYPLDVRLLHVHVAAASPLSVSSHVEGSFLNSV